jgi:hypothetical protein
MTVTGLPSNASIFGWFAQAMPSFSGAVFLKGSF